MNIFKKLFTKESEFVPVNNMGLPYFEYTPEPPERLRQSYEIGEVKEENGCIFYWNGHNWVTSESNHHEIDSNSVEYKYEMARRLNYELDKIERMNTSELCLKSQISVLKDFAEKLGLIEAKNYLNNLNK